jgi:hypothetical protein
MRRINSLTDLSGDAFEFGLNPLFFGRDQVNAGVAGSDVVDNFVPHLSFSFQLNDSCLDSADMDGHRPMREKRDPKTPCEVKPAGV